MVSKKFQRLDEQVWSLYGDAKSDRRSIRNLLDRIAILEDRLSAPKVTMVAPRKTPEEERDYCLDLIKSATDSLNELGEDQYVTTVIRRSFVKPAPKVLVQQKWEF